MKANVTKKENEYTRRSGIKIHNNKSRTKYLKRVVQIEEKYKILSQISQNPSEFPQNPSHSTKLLPDAKTHDEFEDCTFEKSFKSQYCLE